MFKFKGHLLRSTCLHMRAVHQRKQTWESNAVLQVALDHEQVSNKRRGCGDETGVLEAMAELLPTCKAAWLGHRPHSATT